VIENKPGAATNLGADFVAKAAPDGYTVLLGDVATYAAKQSLYKKLQFDPRADAWLRGDARVFDVDAMFRKAAVDRMLAFAVTARSCFACLR
jgi:tripartite-type tricarboxylate transporter receptor subunit TctC